MQTTSNALSLAIGHHQAGRLQEAVDVCRQILAVDPNHAATCNLLGVINAQCGNFQVALDYLSRAIQLDANDPAFHGNLGNVFKMLQRPDDAIDCYRRALALEPQFANAHYNLGAVLNQQGKYDEAITCYRRILKSNPTSAEAHCNLGNVFMEQGKRDEAIACYRKALNLKPDFAEARYNLGNVLNEQGKYDEAIAYYRRALQLNPNYAEAHNNLGNVLKLQGKYDDAVECYRRTLELKPEFAATHSNLGTIFHEQDKREEAIACYRRALELEPQDSAALGALVHGLQHLCQWDDLQGRARRVIDAVDHQPASAVDSPMSPFAFLALPASTTAAQQLRCARQWVATNLTSIGEARHRRPAARVTQQKPRITIGYLSADLQRHATAMLIAELFEKHDRDRFRIVGYSYGRDDGSAMRKRLAGAVDRFVDVRDLSAVQAAERIAADEVDVLVDLTGYTTEARPQIAALRPAPIQVNYLGFPGTMGAPFIDYILVDDFVVPADQQPFFTEKLVHLPGCYQVNDSRREIAARTPSRAECGLPEDGFVFCSFNNNYKITPEVFDVWMRLLRATPGSVLWLLEGHRAATDNLRHEAHARGIASDRLVFAPLWASSEHLARHRLADLFLDTLPYNAHTTASDALWAGCPLLTIAGETFVSRVAGSLLRALGLGELVTTSLDEYEQVARRLADNPGQLAELRARLTANRTTSALFDGGRFARSLEQAYTQMWEIHAAGQEPRAFQVSPT